MGRFIFDELTVVLRPIALDQLSVPGAAVPLRSL